MWYKVVGETDRHGATNSLVTNSDNREDARQEFERLLNEEVRYVWGFCSFAEAQNALDP